MLFPLILLLLSACTISPLKARLERLSPSYTASQKVGMPDPCAVLFCGEQIVVAWKVPRHLPSLSLEVEFIDGHFEYHRYKAALDSYHGAKELRFLGKEYAALNRIMSYHVTLFSENRPLYTASSPSWVPWIFTE